MKTGSSIAISVILIQCLISCSDRCEPETFLIPEGYHGQVMIVYNQKKGKPKKYEGSRRVYEIPENGILFTAFPNEEGIIDQEYYFITDSGKRKKICGNEIFYDQKSNEQKDAVSIYHPAQVGNYPDYYGRGEVHFQQFFVGKPSEMDSVYLPKNNEKFHAPLNSVNM